MREKALESLVDLDHASHEIYLMAHEYLHRYLRGVEVERDHTRLQLLMDRVNKDVIDVRVSLNTLNEGEGG
ncbi:unnamed protein product [marine sediment metagenome]|uniref:Uncharacterized protein n=1 Tax=marine sediment metagenome TaxID=412755 RepID=X1KRU3_9ZZZZ